MIPPKSGSEKRDYAAETEALMADTIFRVAEMDKRLQDWESKIAILSEIKIMLGSISTAQSLMAQSAESMADTFKKSEERYERMESRHEALAALAVGKDQIPLKSHYSTLVAALLPMGVLALAAVVGILYVAKYDIRASLTTLELNQHRTQELILDNAQRIENGDDKNSKDKSPKK